MKINKYLIVFTFFIGASSISQATDDNNSYNLRHGLLTTKKIPLSQLKNVRGKVNNDISLKSSNLTDDESSKTNDNTKIPSIYKRKRTDDFANYSSRSQLDIEPKFRSEVLDLDTDNYISNTYNNERYLKQDYNEYYNQPNITNTLRKLTTRIQHIEENQQKELDRYSTLQDKVSKLSKQYNQLSEDFQKQLSQKNKSITNDHNNKTDKRVDVENTVLYSNNRITSHDTAKFPEKNNNNIQEMQITLSNNRDLNKQEELTNKGTHVNNIDQNEMMYFPSFKQNTGKDNIANTQKVGNIFDTYTNKDYEKRYNDEEYLHESMNKYDIDGSSNVTVNINEFMTQYVDNNMKQSSKVNPSTSSGKSKTSDNTMEGKERRHSSLTRRDIKELNKLLANVNMVTKNIETIQQAGTHNNQPNNNLLDTSDILSNTVQGFYQNNNNRNRVIRSIKPDNMSDKSDRKTSLSSRSSKKNVTQLIKQQNNNMQNNDLLDNHNMHNTEQNFYKHRKNHLISTRTQNKTNEPSYENTISSLRSSNNNVNQTIKQQKNNKQNNVLLNSKNIFGNTKQNLYKNKKKNRVISYTTQDNILEQSDNQLVSSLRNSEKSVKQKNLLHTSTKMEMHPSSKISNTSTKGRNDLTSLQANNQDERFTHNVENSSVNRRGGSIKTRRNVVVNPIKNNNNNQNESTRERPPYIDFYKDN